VKKNFLFAVNLLFATIVSGQTVWEGYVIDSSDKSPVASAVVCLIDSVDEVLAYKLTDSKGHFAIHYNGQSDSLRLRISLIGYKTEIFSVNESNTRMNIPLEVSEIMLKEVMIKSPAIYGKEDTLVFNVGSFQTQQDRTIGDILRKLPGIEVSASGAIKRNGESINRFYIEGLDLLGGMYGIATNNISANEISQVELIDYHQPLRILKDVIISEQSAINLKLKNKKMAKPVGTIKVGAGYEPESLIGLLDVFGLQAAQKRQTIGMIKGNNTGNDITAELTEHYGSMETNTAPTITALLNAGQISAGSFQDSRTLFNKTGIVTLNNLWKTSEYAQFRFNLNYQKEKREQTTHQINMYFSEDSTWVFNEIKSMETKKDQLDGVIAYTDNAPGHYLNNVLKYQTRWNNASSAVYNRDFIYEKYAITNVNISNTLNYTVNKSGRFLNFASFMRYTSLPQKLETQTTLPTGDAQQKVYRSGFYTNNNTYLMVPVLSSQIRIEIRAEVAVDGLNSDLVHLSITDSIRNRLKTDDLKLHIIPTYSYRNHQFNFIVSIPVIYEYLAVNSKSFIHNKQDFNTVYANPELLLRYQPNARWNLSARYNTRHLTGNITDFQDAFILLDYRNLSIKESVWTRNKNQTANLSLNFKDPMKALFFNTSIGYTQSRRNLMTQQNFEDGMLISNNIDSHNRYQAALASIYLGKYISSLYSTISISANYNNFKTQRNQQNKTYPLHNETWSLNPQANAKLSEHFVINYHGEFSRNQMSIQLQGAKQNSSLNSFSHQFNALFFPNKKIEMKLKGEYLYKEITDNHSVTNYFADFELNYKLKQLEFIINLNNIFNQKEYTYTIFNNLDTYQYKQALRPRNFLASIVFSY
jgi:hypothetical protein